MSVAHYLNCTNENCERYHCVERRDWSAKLERLTEENNVRNIPLFKIEADKLREALKVSKEALNETVSAINEAIGSRPGWTHEHKIRLGYTTLVAAGNAITAIDKALNKPLEPSCPACNEEFSCNVCGYRVQFRFSKEKMREVWKQRGKMVLIY